MRKKWVGGRFQAGYELDGFDFKTVVKRKFPAEGAESRAVKRDRLTKALVFWARGQLREWTADYEVYRPMKAEIERMMKAGETVKAVQEMVTDRVTGKSFAIGTSEYQKYGGRRPGTNDTIEEIHDRFRKVALGKEDGFGSVLFGKDPLKLR